jgi:hypothetical protein
MQAAGKKESNGPIMQPKQQKLARVWSTINKMWTYLFSNPLILAGQLE